MSPLFDSDIYRLAALVSGKLTPGEIPSADWPALAPLASRHGLGPMLLWRARQAGIDIQGDETWQPLVERSRRATVWYMVAKDSQRQLEAAFAAAGLPSIWLKGFALAHTVYPQPVLRPMSDLDLLAPFERRQEALEVARNAGFTESVLETSQLFPDLTHHYHLQSRRAEMLNLELHFRLVSAADELLPLDALEWFWGQTERFACQGAEFTSLNHEAHVLYLSAHAILQHGEANFRLLRYYDLHLLLEQAPLFDWDRVLDQAVRLRWTLALERALTLTHELFGTPLPDGLIEALAERRPAAEDTGWVRRGQQPSDRFTSFFKGAQTVGPAGKLRMFLRLVFPHARYMRWRYGLRSDWQIPFYYGYRWFDFAREALRKLAKNGAAKARRNQGAARDTEQMRRLDDTQE